MGVHCCKTFSPDDTNMSTVSQNNYSEYAMQPMTDQQFQDTYGEVPVLRGEFDVASTTLYSILGPALASCIWCPCVATAGFCCYQPIKKGVESRKLTLGERSLFYANDTYCCCGPCMCHCTSSEKQVPLDKLQDLTLSQNFCSRWLGLWTMSFETAGQSGPHAGPELQYTGLKNARDFKQVVLEKRNIVTDNSAPQGSAAPGIADEPGCSSILLRIEQRLADIEAGYLNRKEGCESSSAANDQC